MNHEFDNDNRQFVISYELLLLLKWLFENEHEGLRNLIDQALTAGLEDKLLSPKKFIDAQLSDELQQSVIDFFGILEALIFEVMHEHEVKKEVQQNLLPEASHIDASACDRNLITSSMAKVISVSRKNSKETTKNLLYKELLKRWKPAKKVSLN